MVLMNLKIDNYMAFNDFEMNMSYPKKIVGNPLIEYLSDYPNFRYRKLNIMMGANASGKTTIGKMLMTIFNFIEKKEFAGVLPCIHNHKKDAFWEIQLVVDDTFYRVSSIIKGTNKDSHTSNDFLTKVEGIKLNKNDSYEKCLERLNKTSNLQYNNDYIRELEKINNLSWAFEFPNDTGMRGPTGFVPANEKQYLSILKNTLQALDPLIVDVEKVQDVNNTFIVKLVDDDDTIMIKNGQIIDSEKLSSGTRDGVSLANMFAALVCGGYTFFYCDEKFPYIHSDIEKAFLSLMVSQLKGDSQLFFTTHNMEILDMDFPKHSFNFLRKGVYGDDCVISVENAGEYIKKNTESLKIAAQNDLFSAAPTLEKIFALNEI